jgi:hypothetical protein
MCDQCTKGQTHLDLIEYLVRKHGESYRAHLLHVLLWKEGLIGDARRVNMQLEGELATDLVPTIARRTAELQALRAKAQHARQQQAERDRLAQQGRELSLLESEYRHCLAEVDALRASTSWKLTAPLRAAYDVLVRLRRSSP